MKSKVAGKNYEILANDEDKYAIKVDKKVTDNCLTKLSKAMEKNSLRITIMWWLVTHSAGTTKLQMM